MYIDKKKQRLDCIIIWGHGLKYKNDIIDLVNSDDNFCVKLVTNKKIRNMKNFVKSVYSFDYAPWQHLKSKTKYLNHQKKEVCFVFISNLVPEIEFYGEGQFRHSESRKLKQLKQEIRALYNPRVEGELSEEHVIHATDNEIQALDLLRLANVEHVNYSKLMCNDGFFPWFLKDHEKEYSIRSIDIEELYCGQADGSISKISNSKQYSFIKGDEKEYEEYINSNLGGNIKSYNNVKEFARLSSDFAYLSDVSKNKYIIVKKIKCGYLVLDGLHRTSLCLSLGYKKVLVCVV